MERNQHNVCNFYNHPSIVTWSLGNETVMSDNFMQAIQVDQEVRTRAVLCSMSRQAMVMEPIFTVRCIIR